LGPQRPGIAEGVQVYFAPPVHSNALRAQDGSRSVLSGCSLAMLALARCARPNWAVQIGLALNQQLCLLAHRSVRRKLKLLGIGRLAKPVLAGLLALLLLVAGTISASHSLHQLLHNDASAKSHPCLFCMFAKAQVNVADVALPAAALSVFYPCASRLANPALVACVDYRLCPSRGPPSFIPSITVVG
jgi:hypothetical protein